MRHLFKISIILFLSWIFSPNVIFSDFKENKIKTNLKSEVKKTSKSVKKFVSKYQFEAGYDEALKFIKDHEGFNGGKIYTDVAGIQTVGYGHVILPKDTFTTTVSKELAERILREDFEKAIKAAERETDLQGYKKIAIAHFIFAKGVGNFNKSSLKKMIKAQKNINEELKKWCYYRGRKGKMVKSAYSYNIRLWEIEMYNR